MYSFAQTLKTFIVFLCLAAGLAANAATTTTYPVGGEPKAVVVADFNKDGKQDLASVNRSGHTISILLGNGAGSFAAASNFTTGDTFSEPLSLAVGDFNNDTNLDVVISKPNVSKISLLLGNGSGGLGAPVDFSVGENPATFGVNDFNADGKLDLAVLDFGFNQGGIYIMLGTGTGSFGSPTRITLTGRAGPLVVADFNRDNKSDIAVSHGGINAGPIKISLLLGNGSGGFSAPSDIATGINGALVAADFNKDTFLDLASANGDAFNLSVMKGDGQGGFSAPTNFPTATSAASITSGDFNGDGKLDLAVGAAITGDRISILRGDDNGQFTAPAWFSVESGPYALTSGDFTGSGGPTGLAVANGSSNSLTVLIGPLPSVSIEGAAINEGNSGTSPLTFPLTVSGSINQPITVLYTLTNGTAFAGSDFDGTTAPVTIPAGGTNGSIVVNINGDETFELNESFVVTISNTLNAFVGNVDAGGGIGNDDQFPEITINNASVVEGNSGTRNLNFSVTLTNRSFQAISMTATTADGTAAAGSDYFARTATVNINPGQLSATFTVAAMGDVLSEPSETFFVNLTSPVNAVFVRAQATGTIVDDDPAALVVDGTQRAIAIDSVTFLRDPFSVVNNFNFSSDHRNRLILFAVNLNLFAGDVVTVEAEDAQHVIHQFPVEFVGAVPNFGGLSQIVVKLPDNLGSGDYMVSFTLRGTASNKGLITINP